MEYLTASDDATRHKCESSDDGFHDLGVLEITEIRGGYWIYVQLQCDACKKIYEGNLKRKPRT